MADSKNSTSALQIAKRRQEAREQAARSYASNPERYRRKSREWGEQNRAKKAAMNRRWMQSNAARRAEYKRKYRADNAEAIRRYKQDRYEARKDHAAINRRQQVRMATEPSFKLVKNLRTRIGLAVKEQQSRKHAPTMELVGCSIKEFKAHLESQFTDGMTWANYGRNGWHVDHIRPCIAFDLSDPVQQKMCFSWTNMRPLWSTDNCSKNDRLPDGTRARHARRRRRIQRTLFTGCPVQRLLFNDLSEDA